ncbi:YcaO-like family protein [Actinomyces trachealis]|uniref:YcaO-like family protein n=1 Tax=Actinomyces trachealis TaxID=2763540 RepID=UPI0018928C20|nr:YcaO-like family protein [Actinomyces trachealis]
MVDNARGWTSLEMANRVYSKFVSPLTGIVNSLYNQLHETDDIPGFAVGARACDGDELVGAPVNELNGGGATNYLHAKVAAIGETIERYCGAYAPSDLFTVCDGASHGVEFIYDWHLFHDRQYSEPDFPFARIRPTTELLWTRAQDLLDGGRVAVPADLVYLRPLGPPESTVAYATSNGLACGLSEFEALSSAIFELFERRAFVLTWHAFLQPPRIDAERLFRDSDFWTRHVLPTGLEVRLFAMSDLLGVPSVLAVVLNRRTTSAPISFGAASATSIRRAAEKAVVEAFQTRVWIKAEQRLGNSIPFSSDWNDTIRGFDDHVRLYSSTNVEPLWSAIDFLTCVDRFDEDPRRYDFPQGMSPDSVVAELLSIARRNGLEMYEVDVTTPDVRDEGVSVVKVLSPQLAQLDASYVGRFLGCPSLYGPLPWSGGLQRDFDDLNPVPHPFP